VGNCAATGAMVCQTPDVPTWCGRTAMTDIVRLRSTTRNHDVARFAALIRNALFRVRTAGNDGRGRLISKNR
jgi:hypothetical protein